MYRASVVSKCGGKDPGLSCVHADGQGKPHENPAQTFNDESRLRRLERSLSTLVYQELCLQATRHSTAFQWCWRTVSVMI